MSEVVDLMRRTYAYDPATGILTYKPRPRTKAGAKVGCVDRCGYIKVMLMGKMYFAHRIVWMMHTGMEPDGEIDHINGNKLDNRFENLRIATRYQNIWNKKSQGHAKPKQRKNGLFEARIICSKKRYRIGLFHSQEDANTAYELASIFLHKEFSPYYPLQSVQRAAPQPQGEPKQ